MGWALPGQGSNCYALLGILGANAVDDRTRTGHLLLHRQRLSLDAEAEASRFAGEFLAPARLIASELSQPVTLATLISLKQKWGISLGALLPHLWHSGLISKERFEALRTQLYTRINPDTGRTWGFDEPGWRDRDAERPRLLSAWTERCFGSSNPNAVALAVPELPPDLLGEMLKEQRSGRKNRALPVATGQILDAKVHRLDDQRLKRLEELGARTARSAARSPAPAKPAP